jgi:hypothetical protein
LEWRGAIGNPIDVQQRYGSDIVRRANNCQLNEGFHVGNYVAENQYGRCDAD